MSVFRSLTIVLLIGLAVSVLQAQERKITREQLPPAVEKTVARESEGATIKGFSTEVEHRQRFYEASLIVNGHAKEILIDKNGNIVRLKKRWHLILFLERSRRH